jgi:DNA-binding transcriptional LysR family regulator
MHHRMDWSDLQIVVAVERARTLSAAARALGVNQSTVTRRLAALHAALGERVLVRRGGAYALTAFGETLRPLLAAMEEAALGVGRAARGVEGAGVCGPVRVTTVETLATYFLAPRLPAFAAACPGVALELEVSRVSADLPRGPSRRTSSSPATRAAWACPRPSCSRPCRGSGSRCGRRAG